MFTRFHSLCSTTSSVSPEVKTNAQKRSIFLPYSAEDFGQPMKKKIFLDGPSRNDFKVRGGSGDENALAIPSISRWKSRSAHGISIKVSYVWVNLLVCLISRPCLRQTCSNLFMIEFHGVQIRVLYANKVRTRSPLQCHWPWGIGPCHLIFTHPLLKAFVSTPIRNNF